MGKKALVVGGGRGIGLAVVKQLLFFGYDTVYIIGLHAPDDKEILLTNRVVFIQANLVNQELSFLPRDSDLDFLFISVGFGRVAHFSDLTDAEITKSIKVNELAVIRIIHYYYNQIASNSDFFCGVMGSISGLVSSPLFSVYGATKAALCKIIESINVELMEQGFKNRVLNISPGKLEGTSFYGKPQDLTLLEELATTILKMTLNRELLYIPKYDEVYRKVLDFYNTDSIAFGKDSYNYKISGKRLQKKPQVSIGYLSGTFDLFHIGHLNLIKRAKSYCDYLVVGVHESGAWKGKETLIPFKERLEIVRSIAYVDEAIPSFIEDSDAYDMIKFDYLFVGSDYKGSERFQRYEEYFADKGVQIIYFPYTTDISSTKLRWEIKNNNSAGPVNSFV